MENGKIRLIYGCMKAGKSLYLLNIYNNLKANNKKVEVFQPFENGRDKAVLKSRASEQVVSAKLYYGDNIKTDADFVIFEEANLVGATEETEDARHKRIEKLKNDFLQLKKEGKNIFVTCLDRMANNEHFKQFIALEEISDEFEELSAICEQCSKPAHYTKLTRLPGSTNYVENEFNIYKACCYEHWKPIKDLSRI